MALGLEKIVGKNKMEKLYFNADLRGLINEVEKFTTKSEIIAFILRVDYINSSKYIYNDDKFVINAYNFLIKTYVSKLMSMIEYNQITLEEADEMLQEFLLIIPDSSITKQKDNITVLDYEKPFKRLIRKK